MFKNVISESSLVDAVKEKVRWDIRISNLDIFLGEMDGTVIVRGLVDSAYRKEALLSIIKETRGVKGVVDQLQVIADFHRNDLELEAKVRERIQKNAFSPTDIVYVEVFDGVVHLTGAVSSTRSKAAAAAAAWELSGIRDCINLIEIKHPGSRSRRKNWFESEMGGIYVAA